LSTAKEALAFFLDDEEAALDPTTGGVNNIVQYVDTSKGERYVLRVYNNGFDTPRVKFEHAILAGLQKQVRKFVKSQ
jgi:Ser/Thr protein kinase RdoA (MazF antagonist)